MVDAMNAYREGLQAWRKVLDAHREYLTDQTTNEDLIDMIRRYRHVLSQDNKTLPEPFILQDVIDVHQKEFGGTWSQDEEKPKKEKPPPAQEAGRQEERREERPARRRSRQGSPFSFSRRTARQRPLPEADAPAVRAATAARTAGHPSTVPHPDATGIWRSADVE